MKQEEEEEEEEEEEYGEMGIFAIHEESWNSLPLLLIIAGASKQL